MDDRTLFRYGPGYAPVADFKPKLDWSDYPGPLGGMLGAVEMCNNNGTCRGFDTGVMCPSYRVTRDETHLTRGRANTLRLALTGQLGRRRHGLRRDGRGDGAVRVLQGLQARMPDRRRYGEDEDRGARRPGRTPRSAVAGHADRRAAALCDRSLSRMPCAGEYAQPPARLLRWLTERSPGLFRGAPAADMERRPVPRRRSRRGCAGLATRRRLSACGHLQPLLRAGKPARRRCACWRAAGVSRHRSVTRSTAAVLRADVSAAGMVDKAREEASRTMAACRRYAHRRAGALLLDDVAR